MWDSSTTSGWQGGSINNNCATPTDTERKHKRGTTTLSDKELEALWERLNKRIAIWEKELGWSCPVEEPKTTMSKKTRYGQERKRI
jgi:hypothetical protein